MGKFIGIENSLEATMFRKKGIVALLNGYRFPVWVMRTF